MPVIATRGRAVRDIVAYNSSTLMAATLRVSRAASAVCVDRRRGCSPRRWLFFLYAYLVTLRPPRRRRPGAGRSVDAALIDVVAVSPPFALHSQRASRAAGVRSGRHRVRRGRRRRSERSALHLGRQRALHRWSALLWRPVPGSSITCTGVVARARVTRVQRRGIVLTVARLRARSTFSISPACGRCSAPAARPAPHVPLETTRPLRLRPPSPLLRLGAVVFGDAAHDR